MFRTITISLLFLACGHAVADKVEGARGIAYGVDHAFSMKAPSGWIIDTDSGAREGIGLVFYPAGKRLTNSRVILYVRGRPKDHEVATINDQVKWILRDFHSNGHANYRAIAKDDIKTINDRVAKVFYFTGDKWDNYEAVAYFDEEKTINFLVLNAKSKDEFDAAVPVFEGIAKSYRFIGD